MKKLIIDRFEGDYAVCEQADKSMVNIHKTNLPSEAKEGDIILQASDGSIKISHSQTQSRKDHIQKKMKDLLE